MIRKPAPFTHLSLLVLLLAVQGCAQSIKPAPELPKASAAATAPIATTQAECPVLPPVVTQQVLSGLRQNAKDVGPLWRIEKDGRVSWLYGTIHVGPIERRIPGPNVMKAMLDTDVLGVEIIKPENLVALQASEPIKTGASVPPNPKVQDRRDALVSQLLETHYCLPVGTLENTAAITPVLAGFILTSYAKQKDGIFEEFGLDTVLKTIAAEMKKPVVALERPEDRIRYARSVGLMPALEDKPPALSTASRSTEAAPAPAAPKSLRDITIAVDNETKTFHLGFTVSGKAGASYASLNLAGLDAYLLKYRASAMQLQREWAAINLNDCKDSLHQLCGNPLHHAAKLKSFTDNLAREGVMANEIARLHEGGQRVFVAVGAFHVRPPGLPEMMRAKGFTVEFIKH